MKKILFLLVHCLSFVSLSCFAQTNNYVNQNLIKEVSRKIPSSEKTFRNIEERDSVKYENKVYKVFFKDNHYELVYAMWDGSVEMGSIKGSKDFFVRTPVLVRGNNIEYISYWMMHKSDCLRSMSNSSNKFNATGNLYSIDIKTGKIIFQANLKNSFSQYNSELNKYNYLGLASFGLCRYFGAKA